MIRKVPLLRNDVAELPFHEQLTSGRLADCLGGDAELLLFEREDLEEPGGERSAFTECAFKSVGLTGGSLATSKLRDVWMRSTRLVGTALAHTDWLDCQISASAWSGVQAFESTLRRVIFSGCKIDTVNFRGSDLLDVHFVDCDIVDLDLGQSKLRTIEFTSSRITKLDLTGSDMKNVDLTGAVSLEVLDGLARLDGVVLSPAQAIGLAIPLAHQAGATIGRAPKQ